MGKSGSGATKTRSQADLEMVARRVKEIEKEEWAKIHGGLCHSFPVLVRTCGVAQAVVYHESKAACEGLRAKAHARVVEDFDKLLPGFDLAGAGLGEYMRATRRALAAWAFYKRFAESILNAKAQDADTAKDS